MTRHKLLVLSILIGAMGCTSVPPVVRPAAAPGPELTFFVREAGRTPLRDLSGVRVSGIATDGARVEFGRTFGGKLSIAKEQLRREQIQLLLFCLDGFHCAACDLAPEPDERERPSLLSFDEWNIDLAPFVLYD